MYAISWVMTALYRMNSLNIDDFYKYLYDLGVENSIMKAIPAPRWISCGLSQVNGLVVDPEGYLYRCAHLIGHKNNSIGHLKTVQVFNEENMRFLNASYHEKCLSCQLFPICMGGYNSVDFMSILLNIA